MEPQTEKAESEPRVTEWARAAASAAAAIVVSPKALWCCAGPL